MKRLAAFLTAALLLIPVSAAQAHSHLDGSDPADGATLTVAPEALSLQFTEQPELALSKITVTGPSGQIVDVAAPEVEDGDAKVLRVGLPKLAPGSYKVDWAVTSVDTHSSSGSFGFTVK